MAEALEAHELRELGAASNSEQIAVVLAADVGGSLAEPTDGQRLLAELDSYGLVVREPGRVAAYAPDEWDHDRLLAMMAA